MKNFEKATELFNTITMIRKGYYDNNFEDQLQIEDSEKDQIKTLKILVDLLGLDGSPLVYNLQEVE